MRSLKIISSFAIPAIAQSVKRLPLACSFEKGACRHLKVTRSSLFNIKHGVFSLVQTLETSANKSFM